MPRPTWIAPLYGYLVCVIAVITFLVNASGFVDAAFDRANPLAGRNSFGPFGGSLTSFEAFRATYDVNDRMRPGTAPATSAAAGDTLTTEQLRARYEALRADRIATTSYQSLQRLVKNGLLILLSAVLFWTHWTWVRREKGNDGH